MSRLNPQREKEILEILEHTKPGKPEDLMVFKHISPSLLRLWLEQCLAEIKHLRSNKKSEDDTKEIPNE